MESSENGLDRASRSVDYATELMVSVAQELGILDYQIPEFGSGVEFEHLIDSTAWLPPLMMRMDIESRILVGRPLWDVVYSLDDETIAKVFVRDQEEPTGEPIPVFLATALCRSAILASVDIDHKNKACTLLPFPMYYLYGSSGEDGEDFPLPPDGIIFPVEFNSVSMGYWRSYSLKTQPKMRPSMAGD